MEKNSSSVVIIEQALESKLTQRRSLMAHVEDIPIATMAKVMEGDPKIYKRYHGFWSFIFI